MRARLLDPRYSLPNLIRPWGRLPEASWQSRSGGRSRPAQRSAPREARRTGLGEVPRCARFKRFGYAKNPARGGRRPQPNKSNRRGRRSPRASRKFRSSPRPESVRKKRRCQFPGRHLTIGVTARSVRSVVKLAPRLQQALEIAARAFFPAAPGASVRPNPKSGARDAAT